MVDTHFTGSCDMAKWVAASNVPAPVGEGAFEGMRNSQKLVNT